MFLKIIFLSTFSLSNPFNLPSDDSNINIIQADSNKFDIITSTFNTYSTSNSLDKNYIRKQNTFNDSSITGSTENSDDTIKTSDNKYIGSIPTDMPLLVNKLNPLSRDYVPTDLVIPNISFAQTGDIEKNYVSSQTAIALEQMFSKALEDGITLYAVSGYRSYSRQSEIYNYNVSTRGKIETDKVSAEPGKSEHQTGLAIDISSHSNNLKLNEHFGTTKEGIWLQQNAHQFGFILRYPQDKIDITQYLYEPWHFRFVGAETAQFIFNNNLSLEEYIILKENTFPN